jgi:hypothetical protein
LGDRGVEGDLMLFGALSTLVAPAEEEEVAKSGVEPIEIFS